MRVLILVDAWNFFASTKDLLTPAQQRIVWYAHLGNRVAERLQEMHRCAVTDVEVRLYFSGTREKDLKRHVADGRVDENQARVLESDTRRFTDEPNHTLLGVRVTVRKLPPHAAYWDRARVREPAIGDGRAGPVRTDLEAATLVEKGADTMLAFDAAAAVATRSCDALLIATMDRDQLPVLEELPHLARRVSHQLLLYNIYPVYAPRQPCGKVLRAREAPEFGITPPELKEILCPTHMRGRRKRQLRPYRNGPYGLDWIPPVEP